VPRIRAVREFSVTTSRKSELVDITEKVRSALGELDGAAAALVYVPHTTAGVTINEHADPAVARDFEAALERIVSEDWPWQHVEEGEENAPTHIRAAFMGSDVLVPVQDGRLALGTWQGIFLCEFDGPRTRKVYVTALS
jgi:secondary thiamine-phosphate synthase enzyme